MFWIAADHYPAEILKKESIKGAPAVLSTTNADSLFNTDVHEITEALPDDAVGAEKPTQRRNGSYRLTC